MLLLREIYLMNMRIFLGCILCLLGALLTGCGSSSDGETAVVRGKLLDKGQPFKLDQSKIPLPKGATAVPPGTESSVLRITFVQMGETEQYPAVYNPETSTFEVRGPAKHGIKPGRYKIIITAKYSMAQKRTSPWVVVIRTTTSAASFRARILPSSAR